MLAMKSYEQNEGFSVMTADEMYFVNGGSGFSWGGFGVAVGIGAVTGGLAGAGIGGIGAVPGAIGGACLGGIGYCGVSIASGFGI